MLEARSVAVVGASSREGSFGSEMLGVLQEGSFAGDIYPINPRYSDIAGLPCYGSLAALPAPADLVLLGVPDSALEGQLQAAASCGAASAVIFSTCYEEASPGRRSLGARLAAIAAGAGMALCGNNCMGFVNLEHSLRAGGYRLPSDLKAGGVTFISHSGSAFSALLYNRRGLRFNLVVSSGQELVTNAADYLAYALERPTTKAVALLLETVRSPEAFVTCLDEAKRRDVPLVVCKVGRHERSNALVTAHSGALAGDDGAYEALFDAFGVLRVDSLDEMADTLELLVAGRRAGRGGIATVHDSGGERALVADVAYERGVTFAPLQLKTVARLEKVLEPGLAAVNPLDAWGSGNGYEAIFSESLKALLDDDNIAAVALSVDLTPENSPETGYVPVLKAAWEHSPKPLALLSNLSSAIGPRDAASLRAAGIPVLEGTDTGVAALAHLLALRDYRELPALRPHPPPEPEVRRAWKERLDAGPLDEASGLDLLRAYGISAVAARRVGSGAEAVETGAEIGYPVALKTAAPGISHKAQVAGVRLGLAGEVELAAAYKELAGRLGPEVTIAEMAAPGIELALGVVRDPQFGPLVVVAAGGVLVEVIGDRALALPPVDEVRALRLLERLTLRRVLNRKGADIGALARAVAALSTLALDLPPEVVALDINPIIVYEDGCVAVDVLVEHLGRGPQMWSEAD
ncbi:MAG TPA: acetate--CoA ligase family protein [Actinomycetota bacterium]|nr:acetate--CoA ligase family protein [Actinomycetota bacterium]